MSRNYPNHSIQQSSRYQFIRLLFTYRTSRPFDGKKIDAFFEDKSNWKGVLRSKGFFWVAADHRIAYEWAQAGGVNAVRPIGFWWSAMPKDNWQMPEEQRPDNQPDWHETFGDRKQLLVFIGQEMEEEIIRASLDACLLDELMARIRKSIPYD